MSNEQMVKRLRELADRMERDSEVVEYLGADGEIHRVPVNTRVDFLPATDKMWYNYRQ